MDFAYQQVMIRVACLSDVLACGSGGKRDHGHSVKALFGKIPKNERRLCRLRPQGAQLAVCAGHDGCSGCRGVVSWAFNIRT